MEFLVYLLSQEIAARLYCCAISLFVDFPQIAAISPSYRLQLTVQALGSSTKMPGRPSTRPPTTSQITHEASTRTLFSRKSTATPSSVIPEEGPTSTLRTQICNVFSDAQRSAVGHRKLLVRLRKIQEACCYEPSKPGQQAFIEDDFNVEIARCVIRLMGVKRSEAVGDRTVCFLGSFLRHASENGKENSLRWRH